MVFQGTHLRVLTPRTVDGVTPVLLDGVLQYKEEFLPLSAKPFLETHNKDLPEILRKKIQVIKDGGDSVKEQQKSTKQK